MNQPQYPGYPPPGGQPGYPPQGGQPGGFAPQPGQPPGGYPPQPGQPQPGMGAPGMGAPGQPPPGMGGPGMGAPGMGAPGQPPPGAMVGANPQLNLTPKQQAMLNEFDLLPDEKIVFTIQGDGFFQGANPAAKAIAALQAALVTITGGHVRIFVVVTNQRIVLVQSQQAFCGFRRVKSVQAIALASLAEAGWGRETQWCCIHSRAVHLESKTQRYTLVIKKLGDAALREFVANLSKVMIDNAAGRTAT